MNEVEIVRGCIKKDVLAQHALFNDYASRLMTICRRYARDQPEAEDMLQEAFINIFSHISQYRSIGSFEGWLKRITVNAAIRVLQNRKVRFTGITDSQFELGSPDTSIISDLAAEELLRLIHQLPDGYRTIFNMYALEGYSHDEIAKSLNIKTATSRSQLSKARGLLKAQINLLQKIPGNDTR